MLIHRNAPAGVRLETDRFKIEVLGCTFASDCEAACATGGAIPTRATASVEAPTMPNERVLIEEWEKALVAETLFFQEFAERWKGET